MLALRLARGSHPLVLLRRLCVALAAAGTGFLMLSTIGHAAGHPSAADESLLRLLWCTAPLAATAQFAVSTARTDPAARLQRGMTAAGLGPLRLTLLATVSTTLTCVLGVLVALLVFLRLRGDLGGPSAVRFDADLLGVGHPLPLVGALMLLATVPLTAAVATAVALRPRHEAGDAETEGSPRIAPPSGLPWGIAMAAAGLAIEAYTSRGTGAHGGLLPLPGRLISSPPGVLAAGRCRPSVSCWPGPVWCICAAGSSAPAGPAHCVCCPDGCSRRSRTASAARSAFCARSAPPRTPP